MKISELSNQTLVTKNQNRYSNKQAKQQNPNFKGSAGEFLFNALDKGFSVLDKNAMIQVSFIDSVSTDIPRIIVDSKTSLAAAFETARREFSGLFVNCLMPGLLVKGLAKIMPKSETLKGTNVAGSWANSDAIDKLKGVYRQAQESGAADKTKAYVEKAIGSLEGLNGEHWIKYADSAAAPEYKNAVSYVTEAISKKGSARKELLKKAQTSLAGLTKAENILKFDGKPQANLSETLRDVADLGSKFNYFKEKTVSKISDAVDEKQISENVMKEIDKYGSSLKSFVNKKSLIGLGIVVAIAVSIQSINRAITRKQFNAEGAPIYKDFGKKDTTQKMDEKQKKKFFAKKMASAIGMYGLAAASMMKKPSLKMFQFSGIFPTLDQCRWIAASTFASRMIASEDENELRETTVRDIASFCGLYFLGDYVKKGVASGIEALSKTKKGASLLGENIVLLNRKKIVPQIVLDEGASIGQKALSQVGYRAKQFGNWVKNTELKTAAEVSSVKVRNLRNICRVADIAFSIGMLGILLPKYNRKVTEKKVAEAKKLEEAQKKQAGDFSKVVSDKNTPNIFRGLTKVNTK